MDSEQFMLQLEEELQLLYCEINGTFVLTEYEIFLIHLYVEYKMNPLFPLTLPLQYIFESGTDYVSDSESDAENDNGSD